MSDAPLLERLAAELYLVAGGRNWERLKRFDTSAARVYYMQARAALDTVVAALKG